MNHKPDSHGAFGLDVGTSRIVVARGVEKGHGEKNHGEKGHEVQKDDVQDSHDIEYESQLNAFVSIPYSKITEGVLQRERIPHTSTSVANEIIVHGNESEKFAGLLNAEIRRPMSQGVLDPKEPESLRMLREILGSIAGAGTSRRPERQSESVLYRTGRAARSRGKPHLSRSHGAADPHGVGLPADAHQ